MIAALDRVFLALAWAAGALAAVMMATTASDVTMRYLFNDPIYGAFEVTEISMGLIVFLALPWMIRVRQNIRVTVLFDRLPPGPARWATMATELVCAVLCAFIAWRMWLHGARLLTYGEVTLELRVPKGAVAQTMAAMMAAACLAFLACALDAIRGRTPAAAERWAA